MIDNIRAEVVIQQPGNFLLSDFNARCALIMESHTEEAESKIAQQCLGIIHTRQVFFRDTHAIRKTG